MIEDISKDVFILLLNVLSKILVKVIEYYKQYVDNQKNGEDK